MQVIAPIWVLFFLVATSQSSEIIFTTALADLAKNLNLSVNIAQLCSVFYFCGFTFGIVLAGRLSDRVGRKNVIIPGLAIYCIFSILITEISNVYLLFFYRFFQAFGISTCSIIPQAIVRDCYQGRQLARAYSIISIAICLVPTVASSIGGLIVEYFSWRANIEFLSILGAFALVVCVIFLPETAKLQSIDHSTSFLKIALMLARDRRVLIYALISGGSIGLLIVLNIEFAVSFINLLHIKPSIYGILNGLISFAMLTGNIANIWLNKKGVNNVKIMSVGIILSIIGCGLIFIIANLVQYIAVDKNLIAAGLLVARMFQGIGHVLMMPYILSSALNNYQQFTGSATAIFNGAYYIVITLITLVTSYLHHDDTLVGFATLIFIISLLNGFLFKSLKN